MLPLFTLKMGQHGNTTRNHNPEDIDSNLHRRENLVVVVVMVVI
jgi:hypothetical protein